MFYIIGLGNHGDEWENERSDYFEFTSEFTQSLERIPGRWYNAYNVLYYWLR